MSNYIWVTREGEEIPIEEMKLSHLLAALNYFKDSKHTKSLERVAAIKAELFRRDLDNL